MTTPIKKRYLFKIPVYWTAAQANEVFGFLNELQSALFNAYEDELTRIAREHNQVEQHVDEEAAQNYFWDFDDNIPF